MNREQFADIARRASEQGRAVTITFSAESACCITKLLNLVCSPSADIALTDPMDRATIQNVAMAGKWGSITYRSFNLVIGSDDEAIDTFFGQLGQCIDKAKIAS